MLDIIDIIIVAYIIFRFYKLLKGGLAVYIFAGVVSLFLSWWLVSILKMTLVSMILGQFINLGVIALLIIFQPEIRKFLLVLGNNAMNGNFPFIRKMMKGVIKEQKNESPYITKIHAAMVRMAKDKTGALIVMIDDANFAGLEDTGITMNATVSKELILSIFNKESPLHDGAMVIRNDMILKASCILPVSDNINVPNNAGLRHRAALGLSEVTNARIFIVSEETGKMSYAERGVLHMNIDEDKLLKLLREGIKDV